MSFVAVITGDIVHSSKMRRKQREELLRQLETMFADLDQYLEAGRDFPG